MRTFLIFLFLANMAYAQGPRISSQILLVTVVLSDTSYTERQLVILGELESNVCFRTNYVFCFHNVKQIRVTDDPHHVRAYTGLNGIGDRYIITRRSYPEGISIWINNQEKNGFPHWFMTTHQPN